MWQCVVASAFPRGVWNEGQEGFAGGKEHSDLMVIVNARERTRGQDAQTV